MPIDARSPDTVSAPVLFRHPEGDRLVSTQQEMPLGNKVVPPTTTRRVGGRPLPLARTRHHKTPEKSDMKHMSNMLERLRLA
jgi:hypothetical protein